LLLRVSPLLATSLLLLDVRLLLSQLPLLALRAQRLAGLFLLLDLSLALSPALLLLLEAGLLLSQLPLALQARLLPGLQLPLPRLPVLPAHQGLRLLVSLGGAEGVVGGDDGHGGRSGQHRTARDGAGGGRSDARVLDLRPEDAKTVLSQPSALVTLVPTQVGDLIALHAPAGHPLNLVDRDAGIEDLVVEILVAGEAAGAAVDLAALPARDRVGDEVGVQEALLRHEEEVLGGQGDVQRGRGAQPT
jgi:hypothetical protein